MFHFYYNCDKNTLNENLINCPTHFASISNSLFILIVKVFYFKYCKFGFMAMLYYVDEILCLMIIVTS